MIRISAFTYAVEVYTGDKWQAGTDANVTVQIFGERGDTGCRRLMASKTNTDKFEAGAVSFIFSIIFGTLHNRNK